MSAPVVPEGWQPQFDAHYQTWFYVDLKTGQSQWEAPKGTVFPAPAYAPADSRALQDQQYQQQQYQQQQYQQQQAQQTQQTQQTTKSSTGNVALGAGAGLVGGLLLGEMLDGGRRRRGPEVVMVGGPRRGFGGPPMRGPPGFGRPGFGGPGFGGPRGGFGRR